MLSYGRRRRLCGRYSSSGSTQQAAVVAEVESALGRQKRILATSGSAPVSSVSAFKALYGAELGSQVTQEYAAVALAHPGMHTPLVSLCLLASSGVVLYDVAYVVTAAVGFGYPLVYCLHLLDLVFVSLSLGKILDALHRTWRQLALTAALVVVVVYAYAVAAFVYHRQLFVYEDLGDYACDSLAGCFYFILHDGVLTDIAGSMPSIRAPTSEYVGMLLFNLSFFAVVKVVLVGGVVFSLIINKFGELRDALKAASVDRKTVCFMCDVTRHRVERSRLKAPHTFQDHTQRVHNVRASCFHCGVVAERLDCFSRYCIVPDFSGCVVFLLSCGTTFTS